MESDKITRLENKSIVIKFYNIERWLWTHKLTFLSKIIWRMIYILFSCQIPPTAVLEDGVNIPHGVGIVIHQNTKIGKNTVIYQHVTIGSDNGPQIGENCILGAGACVLGNVTIGNNVHIGANAVVISDVPDDCTAIGVPAKIIKRDKILSEEK